MSNIQVVCAVCSLECDLMKVNKIIDLMRCKSDKFGEFNRMNSDTLYAKIPAAEIFTIHGFRFSLALWRGYILLC